MLIEVGLPKWFSKAEPSIPSEPKTIAQKFPPSIAPYKTLAEFNAGMSQTVYPASFPRESIPL